MANEKWLMGYNPITFEAFTRHCTKHREPHDQYDMGYTDAVDNIESWLDGNKVDVVEVVRCKDCKHYEKPDEGDYLGVCRSGRLAVSIFGEIYPEPDYYCPYGERKDND